MILLADAGSTKTDWSLTEKGKEIKRITTSSANPFFCTYEDISEDIKTNLIPKLEEYKIENVYFFGAGCINVDKSKLIYDAIARNIKTAHIEVESDLLGAARGLCGNSKGIACILGTGSNSCHYDGDKIVQHISPLGYILGDEGSGAVLGRLFIGACLKNQLGEDIKSAFLKKYNLTPALILDKVYKESAPNRFLASFSPFILQYIDNEDVYNLVYNTFKDFFIKNVMQYDFKNNLVHFTGSIAFFFKDILSDVAKDLEIGIGNIQQSPIKGLIEYYKHVK